MSDSWLDITTDEETLAETEARGGSLSVAGRRAAIASTLPLLGLYFSSGNQPLYATAAIGNSEVTTAIPQLLAGVRLRVALASAARLEVILSRIVERPTFRYQLRTREAIGAVTGTLDVNRFVTTLGAVTETPSYPVAYAERTQHTVENILAAYVALWIIRELKSSFHVSVAPPESPEGVEYRLRLRALQEIIRLPGLAGCIPKAREINRNHSETALLKETQSRLRRREISNASPYQELVAWVQQTLSGQPAVEAGDLDWSFYGDRFDTKLFELWCLQVLAREISQQLCVDLPALDLNWRNGKAAYTWNRPAGTLRLSFQRSVGSISTRHGPQWIRLGGGQRPLGGVPDIVAHAVGRIDGEEKFAIIDPKLRQRGGSPVEELYKILGYLNNFGLSQSPNGAILYHTTSGEAMPVYAYGRNQAEGRLFAVALNPINMEQSQEVLRPVAEMCLGLLGIPSLVTSTSSEDSARDPETYAEVQVGARVRELQALAERKLPASSLDASKRRVEALLGKHRWNVLPNEVQIMLATSEHVGFSLEPVEDFSGPVIGICASAENILHDRVLTPAIAHNVPLGNSCKTLGQVIYATIKALTNGNDVLHHAIRARLAALNATDAAVLQLMQDMANMNKQYRIPAAHRDLVGEAAWHAAWNLMVGSNGMVAKLIDRFVL